MTDAIEHSGALMVPDETDSELAATASRELARASKEAISVRLEDGTDLLLPKSVTALLVAIMTEMAKGNAVTLTPIHAELTTQEAANLLGVSRPFLIKLLDEGNLPFHRVGTHRRVRFTDLEAYRKRRESERRTALAKLAAQAQELGMGY